MGKISVACGRDFRQRRCLMGENEWQAALQDVISDPRELWETLGLDPKLFSTIVEKQSTFPLRVPRGFVAKMERGNPKDPLLLQILPTLTEQIQAPHFSLDPLHEKKANTLPGLLHKYHGRVLITLATACAVNCRYCFRRHFPYSENNPGKAGWTAIFNYLREHPKVSEVILSGGDPLMLRDLILKSFVSLLEEITSIKRLRIHTRFPVVIPERITQELSDLLSQSRFSTSMVLHINHPNEIDEALIHALQKIRLTKTVLLNQSVLLKDINDQADILIHLSERLFEAGILPYYLNLPDRVQGSAHFSVTEEKGRSLMKIMSAHLPGYLVPKLVREVPEAPSKIPLSFY